MTPGPAALVTLLFMAAALVAPLAFGTLAWLQIKRRAKSLAALSIFFAFAPLLIFLLLSTEWVPPNFSLIAFFLLSPVLLVAFVALLVRTIGTRQLHNS